MLLESVASEIFLTLPDVVVIVSDYYTVTHS